MDKILKYLSNFPGWRTTRKIIVIESDDWGSIRMPSLSVLSSLKAKQIDVTSGDNGRFNSLDTLASGTDLELLFSTLRKYKDSAGNHPIITAMALCGNPDFERISQSKFSEYFFELFTNTLARYGLNDAFECWKQGERERLFVPEFHGREHLNVKVWMDDLQLANQDTLEGFASEFWGFRSRNKSGISYQAAFDLDDIETLHMQRHVIKSGLNFFEELHGRRARFFVPPNGAIHEQIVNFAGALGIRYVSSPKILPEPQGGGKVKKRFRYLGMKGKGGIRYLTRNCFFEPSYKGRGFSTADCLQHIRSAFFLNKPAIISTHRVNFVGGLQEQNRRDGNRALDTLLKEILKRWPSVEFMTSPDLGALIADESHHR